MTDKDEQQSDNNIDKPDSTADEQSRDVTGDDLDIEGALAAVASLQDLTREAEPEIDADEIDPEQDGDELEIRAFERIEGDESALDESGDEPEESFDSPETYESVFPRPPVGVLHRGQLASVVPAILLIGIGVYLTFIVTTSSDALDPSVVIAMLIAGTGAMLLAQWISSARWAIGSFFIGVLLLLTGATASYLVLPNNLSLMDGYPLVLTAIGMAFVITDIFAPSGQRIWLVGLVLAIAGLAGVVTTTSLINLSIADSLSGLLPVAIVIIIILLIAPVLRRRQ